MGYKIRKSENSITYPSDRGKNVIKKGGSDQTSDSIRQPRAFLSEFVPQRDGLSHEGEEDSHDGADGQEPDGDGARHEERLHADVHG